MFNLVLEESRLPKDQIRSFIHERIVSGAIAGGSRLPSTESLAKRWDTHYATVHAALTDLVKGGWLVRIHGRGTFVRERPRNLKTIGLYYFGGRMADTEARFLRALHQCLLRRIEQSGREWVMMNDPRPARESSKTWKVLIDACRRQEVDAVIVPVLDPMHQEWLRRLPVPVAFLTSARVANRVEYNMDELGRLTVDELVHQGCHSVGMISAWPSRTKHPESIHGGVVSLFNAFMKSAAAHGMLTRNEWIVTRTGGLAVPSAERWGYEAFEQLWQCADHPDGLVVVSDAEAVGVTAAILERAIRVPRDLKLVYQKNAEVDIPCPLPVTYIVDSADQAAEGLITIVERGFRGEKVVPIVLSATVERPPMRQRQTAGSRRPAAAGGLLLTDSVS
ncbi:MAG: substrate-binding domain-containing protein [Kiritimatiellae bacterium]|nr:substrate-binding domain-containing protein [Kiritimatiellia bacterium]